jgi:hypothetical protein
MRPDGPLMFVTSILSVWAPAAIDGILNDVGVPLKQLGPGHDATRVVSRNTFALLSARNLPSSRTPIGMVQVGTVNGTVYL